MSERDSALRLAAMALRGRGILVVLSSQFALNDAAIDIEVTKDR
jgi:hypothetical protein